MKKIDYLILACFLTMILYNLFLNNKNSALKKESKFKMDEIYEFRQIINNNSSIAGTKLSIKGIQPTDNYRIIYRFTDSCCFDCVQEGLVLLENRFKNMLDDNLLIVGSPAGINQIKKYHKIVQTYKLFKNEPIKDPYVCFINPDETVLFYLILKQKNYQINREVLNDLNNNLTSVISTDSLSMAF